MMAQADAPPVLERDTTPVPEDLRIGVAETAGILGVSGRTVERWYDRGWLAGGRLTDPDTGLPYATAHRWFDVRDTVRVAVDKGRADMIPEKWRHLIPAQRQPDPTAR
jgi:hypothetical protein